MIDAIIRGTLGDFGSALLDFYLNNALWINAILLLYAVFLLFAKQGYHKLVLAIKESLFESYGKEIQKKNENWFKKILERDEFDWQVIAKQTWIPIISTKHSLGFKVKSAGSLKKIFTSEKIKEIFQEE
jgi:hypothetical protein